MRKSRVGWRHVYTVHVALVCVWLVALPLWAIAEQNSTTAINDHPISLQTIVVTASRLPERLGDVPAAISVVEQPDIQDAQQTVSPAEPLNRVPGVFVQDSGNFAQDARVQIRGFGNRTAFGIRDIKVLVDGLPETLPDGQTDLDSLGLGAIHRIEVLRGPASSLYGNASGGVIQLFTEDGPDEPQVESRLTGGSFGLQKYQLKGGGRAGNARVFLHSSFFQLDGFRDHSATRSGIVNGKLQYTVDERSDVTFLLNGVESPRGEDPGGLTRAEADANRHQASKLSRQLDTGEEVEQGRLGAVGRRRTDYGEISAYGYALYRDFQNRLPIAASAPAVQGGIVVFHRFSPGSGVRYLFDAPVLGVAQKLTAGVDVQHQDDERRRYVNLNGERGVPGLHQHERVTSVGPYVREAVFLRNDLEASLGLRYDRVNYDADVDFPSAAGSGERTLDAWSPAGGLRYSPRQWLSFFGNIGTAFQVPTTTELANPNGAGFNPDLAPQHATSYELGGRAEWERLQAGLTAFYLEITDVLIPFDQNGRTFFRNAGGTRRYGTEADWQAMLLPSLRWTSTISLLRAEFRDGRDEPGIPSWQIYQELAYRHRSGLFAAIEATLVDHYAVNDANSAHSRHYELGNLRAGYEHTIANWTIAPFVGLSNLSDALYDGRVRINAQGDRFFEPAPGFNTYGGLTVSAQL